MPSIDVTVFGLSGNVLIGPATMVSEGLLQDLQARLLDGRVGQEVQFILKGTLVDADAAFEGMTKVELRATFSEAPLDFELMSKGQGGVYGWTDTLSVEKAEDLQQKQQQWPQGTRMWTARGLQVIEMVAAKRGSYSAEALLQEFGSPSTGSEVTASQIEVAGNYDLTIDTMQVAGCWTNPEAEWPEYFTVVSPDHQNSKAGHYRRDHTRNHDGLPMWKQVHSESPQFDVSDPGNLKVNDGSNVIYSHSGGFWMIGPERKISDESGGIVSKSPHCGRHAGIIKEWRVWTNDGFKEDGCVKVSADEGGHRDLKHNPKFQWYTYSEENISGSECLTHVSLKEEALASHPDKAEAIFKLLEKQPMVTVERVHHEANHNEERVTSIRVPGYKITMVHDLKCCR